MLKILTVSDKVDEMLYSPAIRRMFADVDLVLGCGDLPFYYMEFIVTMLGGPLFYVIGNHAYAVKNRYAPRDEWEYPKGCENIDGRVVRYRKLLIAGLEGSMRYNRDPDFQYTEREMAWKMWQLAPVLLMNRALHGRYLDILVTHAPPAGIHDRSDRCHQGFQAFRTFIDRFRPRYLVHGHIHVYNPSDPVETVVGDTTVINTYGYKTIEIDEESLS
ncbi:MAG TPA: metallophosphoesterase [Anaerolineae bacterium]|nr:metallophosphoesterase [Anaerolineae bacterium]